MLTDILLAEGLCCGDRGEALYCVDTVSKVRTFTQDTHPLSHTKQQYVDIVQQPPNSVNRFEKDFSTNKMLTEMETMSELAEIKSEMGASDFHGSGSGSVDSNSTSATPQPHHNNFNWVS